jgi:uncharacterized membrane-anchored protein YhcB (DUF1043 family)
MNWFVVSLFLAAGIIIGYMICRLRNPDIRIRELEQHLETLQSKWDNYQEAVTQHFVTAAQLSNQVSKSYLELHQHLQENAQTLCASNTRFGRENPAENFDSIPKLTPAITKTAPSDDADLLMPPRDYADKSPHDTGTLDESFGLKS